MRDKSFIITYKHAFITLLVLQYIFITVMLSMFYDGWLLLCTILTLLTLSFRKRLNIKPISAFLELIILIGLSFIDNRYSFFMIIYIAYLMYYGQFFSILIVIAYLVFMNASELEYGLFFQASLFGTLLHIYKKEVMEKNTQIDVQRKEIYLLLAYQEELIHENTDIETASRVAERQKIAEQLHDNIGHELTAAILSFNAYQKLKDKDIEKANERLLVVEQKLSSSMKQLKDTVKYIEPMILSKSDEWFLLLESFEKRIRQKINGNLTYVTEHMWQIIINVTKEALTNIRKHASPTLITLQMDVNEHSLRIIIENDGIHQLINNDGHGLKFMRKRIETVGGTFSIQQTETFKLLVSIPRIGE